MESKAHWEKVYQTKAPDAVSWFAPHLETSLNLIEQAVPDKQSTIIDVGGGEATLVDDLLVRGYQNISVLDISQTAINVAKNRIGEVEKNIQWYCADITLARLPESYFDVWHDRAVFHFLIEPEQRSAYIKQVMKSVKLGGHVIISTFGLGGPEKCSGLEVVRYDAHELHDQFGRNFNLIKSSTEIHHTPFGTNQQFLYCYCRLEK